MNICLYVCYVCIYINAKFSFLDSLRCIHSLRSLCSLGQKKAKGIPIIATTIKFYYRINFYICLYYNHYHCSYCMIIIAIF